MLFPHCLASVVTFIFYTRQNLFLDIYSAGKPYILVVKQDEPNRNLKLCKYRYQRILHTEHARWIYLVLQIQSNANIIANTCCGVSWDFFFFPFFFILFFIFFMFLCFLCSFVFLFYSTFCVATFFPFPRFPLFIPFSHCITCYYPFCSLIYGLAGKNNAIYGK